MQSKKAHSVLAPIGGNALSHIRAYQKISSTNVDCSSILNENKNCFRFFFFCSGKFSWSIEKEDYTLLPNDILVVIPGKTVIAHGNQFEVGVFYELSIYLEEDHKLEYKEANPWSGISNVDFKVIKNLLENRQSMIIPKYKYGVDVFLKISQEIKSKEIGFRTKINAFLDDLLISTSRMSGNILARNNDFKQLFSKFDDLLRQNLAHPWSVSEMAGVVGYGVTSFTEKVKNYCGFSPLNYLINLRIAEAIRLLKNTELSMGRISLQVGFYSSQHFSTTFKKVTGFSPMAYRKNIL